MDLHGVIERPLVTEKSSIAREEANIAPFRVNPAATKHEIGRASFALPRLSNRHFCASPSRKRRSQRLLHGRHELVLAELRLAHPSLRRTLKVDL